MSFAAIRNRILFCLFVFEPNHAMSALLHDPNIHWKSIHSDNFIVHYPDSLEKKAQQTDLIAEAVHRRLRRYFDWTPQHKTEIVITENALSPSGYAQEIPLNRITLHVKPSYPDEYGYAQYALLIAHEYTHILHLDKVKGAPAALRNAFGRFNLLFPNTKQPTWGIEGLASYAADYWVASMSRGEGVGYQALMRMEVENGIKPLSQINIPVDEWPFTATPYLYGEEWFRYLAMRYGEDSVRNLVENYSNNLLPFFINSNSRSVYEKDLTTLYREFSDYVNNKYGAQIEAIKAEAFPVDEPVSGQVGNCGSLVELKQKQYFLCNDWLSATKLMQRDIVDGSVEIIDELPDAGLLDGRDNSLLVIREDWERNTINTYDLYIYDIVGRRLNRLSHDGYYVSAKWMAGREEIIALRYYRDQYRLDLLGANGELIKSLWQSAQEEKLALHDISRDGKRLLLSVLRHGQLWQLEEFTISSGSWRHIYGGKDVIRDARYDNVENRFLLVADFNQVPNLYRLDSEAKTLTQLSNVVSMVGSVRQFASGVYYAQSQIDGVKFYKLKDVSGKPFDYAESAATSEENEFSFPNVDQASFESEDYNPLPGLKPTQLIPQLNISNKLKMFGFKTMGTDALHRHRYSLLVDHVSTVSQNEYQFNYRYDRYYPRIDYQVQSQLSLFHDNKDVLTSIERSNRHDISLVFPYLKSRSRWMLYTGIKKEDFHWYAKDSNVDLQNPPSENVMGIALMHDSSQSYARSITISDGRSLRLVLEKSLSNSDYQGKRWQGEWREYFNLGRAQVLSASFLAGRAYDSLRAYSLGGEAELRNMTFHPSSFETTLPASPFSRRGFPFRGYASGIPALTGKSMALMRLDWTLPLARVNRSFMAPPIGIRHIDGRVFVDRGDAWSGHAEWKTGYGMELRLAMQLFYRQSATWRFGVSRGNQPFSETRWYHYINIQFF